MKKIKSSLILTLITLSGLSIGFSSWISISGSKLSVDVSSGDVEVLPFFETYGITFTNLDNNLNYVITENNESKNVYFLETSFSLNINFDFSGSKTILNMPYLDSKLTFNPIITFKNPSTGEPRRITPQIVNNKFIYTNNYIYSQNLPNRKYDLNPDNLGRSSVMMKSTDALSLYQLAIADITYKDTNQSTVVLDYIINLSDEDVFNTFSDLILKGYTTINYSVTINLE